MVTDQGMKKVTLDGKVLYMEGKKMIAYEEHLILVVGKMKKAKKRLSGVTN